MSVSSEYLSWSFSGAWLQKLPVQTHTVTSSPGKASGWLRHPDSTGTLSVISITRVKILLGFLHWPKNLWVANHTGAKTHFFFQKVLLILTVLKCEFCENWDFKGEFCEKWDFRRNVIFVKIDILEGMWILWKLRF